MARTHARRGSVNNTLMGTQVTCKWTFFSSSVLLLWTSSCSGSILVDRLVPFTVLRAISSMLETFAGLTFACLASFTFAFRPVFELYSAVSFAEPLSDRRVFPSIRIRMVDRGFEWNRRSVRTMRESFVTRQIGFEWLHF